MVQYLYGTGNAAGLAARATGEGKNVETTTIIQIALLVIAVVAGIFSVVCVKKYNSQYVEGCIFAVIVAVGLAIMLGIG